MQEICWFLRYFTREDELLSGTPLVRLQSGRPAVSHFFRGVTDFFMPKHCIYFFHILLSWRFIFLRCGKSWLQFTIHLLLYLYLNTVVSVFKNSRISSGWIKRSPVFLLLFHSLAQSYMHLNFGIEYSCTSKLYGFTFSKKSFESIKIMFCVSVFLIPFSRAILRTLLRLMIVPSSSCLNIQ